MYTYIIGMKRKGNKSLCITILSEVQYCSESTDKKS